jgi:hypothetical protein
VARPRPLMKKAIRSFSISRRARRIVWCGRS